MKVQKLSAGGGNDVTAPQKQATLQLDKLNQFPLNRNHATSLDFSKVVPVDNLKTVARDVIDLSTQILNLGNGTQAPIMSNIRQVVDTYRVPYQAIYGDDWENVIGVIKQKGDSAPTDARAWFSPSNLLDYFITAISRLSADAKEQYYDSFFRLLLTIRSIFGDESIFPYFNIHLNKVVSSSDEGYIGPFVAERLRQVYNGIDTTNCYLSVDYDGYLVRYYIGDETPIESPELYNYRKIESFAQFIEIIENAPSIDIIDTNVDNTFSTIYYVVLQGLNTANFTYTGYNGPINFEAIVAYQLVLADKFSNSRIDNVYTPRQYLNMLKGIFSNSPYAGVFNASYSIDGANYFYSPVSNSVFSSLLSTIIGTNFISLTCKYLLSLFSFGRPMRFGDYFTASRLEPLAQGDVNVTVTDGEVNVVDVNKREWLYSFLYNLNIAGSEFKDYVKGIFGSSIQPSRADIIRLVRTERFLGKESIENTGTAQFNYAYQDGRIPMSTALRGTSNPAKLVYHSSETGLLVTVVWHDVEIYRSNSISKDAFVQTVEDEFIPQLEFTGDQVVMNQELDASTRIADYFSWNQRYAEYKMRYSFASGAFLGDYGNEMIVTDSGYVSNNGPEVLSSDFIRQSIVDYQRFFPNNMFYTMPVHCYAIVMSDIKAMRPMFINPQPMK